MAPIVRSLIVLAAAALAFTIRAQDAAAVLRGPVLGFLFDTGGKTLHPILGIPGSLSLGGPLPLDRPLEQAVLAPASSFALAAARDDAGALRIALVILPPAAAPERSLVLTGTAWPDLLAVSPSGLRAAAYYRDAGGIDIFRIRPDGLQHESSLAAPGAVEALAVDDSGERILARTAVYLALIEVSTGEVRSIPVPASSTFEYFPSSLDALVGERDGGAVYRLSAAGELTLVLAAREGSTLTALCANPGGGGAAAFTNELIEFSLDGAIRSTHPLPSAIHSLRRPARSAEILALPHDAASPRWLLTGPDGARQTFFIPAGKETARP